MKDQVIEYSMTTYYIPFEFQKVLEFFRNHNPVITSYLFHSLSAILGECCTDYRLRLEGETKMEESLKEANMLVEHEVPEEFKDIAREVIKMHPDCPWIAVEQIQSLISKLSMYRARMVRELIAYKKPIDHITKKDK